MGLINHDPYPIRFSGETKTDTYIHFPNQTFVNIRKDNNEYIISAQAIVRWSQNCASISRDPVDGIYVESRVDYNTISTISVFAILYNKLKETYTNHTDII